MDKDQDVGRSDITEDQIFCPDQLVERCLGRIDFAQRVLDVFLSNMNRDVDELLEAIHQKNGRQLAQTAHRIKGSAASISARRLQQLMAEIEEDGRQDAIPDDESLQHRIHSESQSLKSVLVRWRSEDQPPVSSDVRDTSRLFLKKLGRSAL